MTMKKLLEIGNIVPFAGLICWLCLVQVLSGTQEYEFMAGLTLFMLVAFWIGGRMFASSREEGEFFSLFPEMLYLGSVAGVVYWAQMTGSTMWTSIMNVYDTILVGTIILAVTVFFVTCVYEVVTDK